jgi:nickel-type superoxide dismutase maturation protease
MSPALRAGDRLLVESRSYRRRLPRVGEVVVAPDPREPARELIKRVTAVDAERSLVELRGDAPEASTDSRLFGPVAAADVRWRVVGRYWPRPRFGRL